MKIKHFLSRAGCLRTTAGRDRVGERDDLLLRDGPGRAPADLLGDEGAVADESQHGHGAHAEPLRGVYDCRTDLRRLLCDTDRLTYTLASVSGAECSHCRRSIGIEFHFAYRVPESVYMSRLVCHDCARDARFEIAPAASVARVDLRPVGERGNGDCIWP